MSKPVPGEVTRALLARRPDDQPRRTPPGAERIPMAKIDGVPRVTAYRNSAGESLEFGYDFAGGRRGGAATAARGVAGMTTTTWREYTDFDQRRYGFIYQRSETVQRRCPAAQRQSGMGSLRPPAVGDRSAWPRNALSIFAQQRPAVRRRVPDRQREAQRRDRWRPTRWVDALGNATLYRYPR
ncbi:hypothetical protein M8494_11640 [Serratia ureilytica]